MAALVAAEQGVRVALVKHCGFLGGINSASGVSGVGCWQFDFDGLPFEFMERVSRNIGTQDHVARLRRPNSNRSIHTGSPFVRIKSIYEIHNCV